jgi:hypothetical protein
MKMMGISKPLEVWKLGSIGLMKTYQGTQQNAYEEI